MKRIIFIIVAIATSFRIEAQSLLWEISGNKTQKPSYLFGTIHIKDKRVFDFNDSLPAVMNKVDQLALEVDMSTESILESFSLLMLDEGKTLNDILSKEAYKRLKNLVEKELEVDMSMYDKMHPFAAISGLTQSKFSNDMPVPVDLFLNQKAKTLGIPIVALETIAEQIAIFDHMDSEDILRFCDEFESDDTEKEIQEMITTYLNADLEKMHEITEESEGYDEDLKKRLLDDRNVRMVDRIDTMIQRKPSLIVVGAGHFSGNIGLIQLLRNKGYDVKPIIARKSPWPETKEELQWKPIDLEGSYVVEMPGEASRNEQLLPTEVGEINYVMHMHQSSSEAASNLLYAAAIMTYPEGVDVSEKIVESYDNAMNGAATNVGGNVLFSEDIQLLGKPARQAEISYLGGLYLITMRCVITSPNEMILLQSICSAANKGNNDQQYFFHTLKAK